MKKPEDIDNSPLQKQVKAQLDESLDAISDEVLNKLAAARQRAVTLLAQKGAKIASQQPTKPDNVISLAKLFVQKPAQWSKPAWAMAASVCLMVPIWYGLNNTQSPGDLALYGTNEQSQPMDSPFIAQSTSLTALDIMTGLADLDEDELEILEDLEFALWLNEGGLNEQDGNQQGSLEAGAKSVHG
ncbi:MAG: DUF3619 family protein [Bermanella sp.]